MNEQELNFHKVALWEKQRESREETGDKLRKRKHRTFKKICTRSRSKVTCGLCSAAPVIHD